MKPVDSIREEQAPVSMTSRDDPRRAAEIMRESFPNRADRDFVLTQLSESIQKANSVAPNAWAVTLYENGFRLNVGRVEVLTAFDGQVGFFTHGGFPVVPEAVRNYIHTVNRKSIPGLCHFFSGSVKGFRICRDVLLNAHYNLIATAGRTKTGRPVAGTPHRGAHSPGLVGLAHSTAGLRPEDLVVGRSAGSTTTQPSNPDWTRDELILALNFYLTHRPNPPGKDSTDIQDLSQTLNRLGERLFPPESRADTFRNANGVYMKLMNFRRLDPQYIAEGKKGLTRGAKAEEDVWAEFADDPARCRCVAEAIMAGLEDPDAGRFWPEPDNEDITEAPEGRLLTRKHLERERKRELVEAKRRQVLARTGRLVCEACGFDFGVRYGEHGKGFIECHHTKPLGSLDQESKTHIDDLALVCANCHRMIHRRKRWLTIAELKALLVPPSSQRVN